MHQRPYPIVRSHSNISLTDMGQRPLFPGTSTSPGFTLTAPEKGPVVDNGNGPTIFGMPIKYVS